MEEVLLLGIKDRAGYLSFWNDSISYALRGAVLLELALRGRIGIAPDPVRFDMPVQDRGLEVYSREPTGEVLLDEALRHMALYQASKDAQGIRKRKSCVQWTDVLAGETWDWTQITYQLRAVRERLAKGLVDKGVLRTEKSHFLLFDMATHPLADVAAKQAVLRRVHAVLVPPPSRNPLSTASSSASSSPSLAADFDPQMLYPEERHPVLLRVTRTLCTVCVALAANVLENALVSLNYARREAAFERADALMAELGQWPMAPNLPAGGIGDPTRPLEFSTPLLTIPEAGDKEKKRVMPSSLAEGSVALRDTGRCDEGVVLPTLTALVAHMREEMRTIGQRDAVPQFEAVAGILGALARMDCLVRY